MTHEERLRLIDRYANGADEVAASLEGFPERGLGAHPIPGKWSAAEIVHHLADSESAAGLRIRMLLAHPHPVIYGYDQDEYATRLRYNEREIAPALQLLRAVRESTTWLLRTMSDADWTREGWHTESGRYSAERWLSIYADHAHDHAAQIRRLGEALGS